MKKDGLTTLVRVALLQFFFILFLSLSIEKLAPPQSSSLAQTTTVTSAGGGLTPTPTPSEQHLSPIPPPSPTPTQTTEPLAEVAQHNTVSDCWIIIGGKVYNITAYFGSHPGGDGALSQYCGQDATEGFATKDKDPGVAHSQAASSQLAQFEVL